MKKNYSYTYLLPLLAEQVYFDSTILNYIKNTYIFSNKYSKSTHFFILCHFDYSDPNFSELESRLTSTSLFVNSHDIGEDVLYVFNFPKEYEPEFYSFIRSKYSLFDKRVKHIILSFWTELYGSIPSFVTGPLLKIRQVLFKDKKLKEKIEAQLSSKGHRVVLPENAELGEHVDVEKEQFIFPDSREITLESIKDIFK